MTYTQEDFERDVSSAYDAANLWVVAHGGDTAYLDRIITAYRDLVNRIPEFQALWDAAEALSGDDWTDSSGKRYAYVDDDQAEGLFDAVESLRDLLGGDHAIKDS